MDSEFNGISTIGGRASACVVCDMAHWQLSPVEARALEGPAGGAAMGNQHPLLGRGARPCYPLNT
jgi:hypothetical protein